MIENNQELEDKLNEYLSDSSVKTEEEKKFITDVINKLKNGQIPVDDILNKLNTSISTLENLKKTNPEFESFVNHYQNKINDSIKQFNELIKQNNNGQSK